MKLDSIELDRDHRLYATQPDGWTATVKRTAEKEYCYFKSPGDEHYHLLMVGELYVEHNGEKSCLNCAIRHGALTHDRTHWKRSE